MRNKNKFLKLFSLVAFLAFMFISCWATVESLHRLLPSWPIPIFWIATIGGFVLSSIGTKLLVNCFSPGYKEYRGWQFMGGFLLLAVFWIAFSLPTNTHTFFYRSVINNELTNDLSRTENYLNILQSNTLAQQKIEAEWEQLALEIEQLMTSLQAEINHAERPGQGPEVERILLDIEKKLGTPAQPAKIVRYNGVYKSASQRNELYERYLEQIKILANNKDSEYQEKIAKLINGMDNEKIAACLNNIHKLQDELRNVKDVDDDLIEAADIVLTESYAIINNYSDQIKFMNDDKNVYAGKVTQSQRMLSVIDVWRDYFDGRYAGLGFAFWIMIAALVDIAGFIFFALAFKRDEI